MRLLAAKNVTKMKHKKIFSVLEIEALAATFDGTLEDFNWELYLYLKSSRKAVNKIAKDLNIYAGKVANVHYELITHLVGGAQQYEVFTSNYNNA